MQISPIGQIDLKGYMGEGLPAVMQIDQRCLQFKDN